MKTGEKHALTKITIRTEDWYQECSRVESFKTEIPFDIWKELVNYWTATHRMFKFKKVELSDFLINSLNEIDLTEQKDLIEIFKTYQKGESTVCYKASEIEISEDEYEFMIAGESKHEETTLIIQDLQTERVWEGIIKKDLR